MRNFEQNWTRESLSELSFDYLLLRACGFNSAQANRMKFWRRSKIVFAINFQQANCANLQFETKHLKRTKTKNNSL